MQNTSAGAREESAFAPTARARLWESSRARYTSTRMHTRLPWRMARAHLSPLPPRSATPNAPLPSCPPPPAAGRGRGALRLPACSDANMARCSCTSSPMSSPAAVQGVGGGLRRALPGRASDEATTAGKLARFGLVSGLRPGTHLGLRPISPWIGSELDRSAMPLARGPSAEVCRPASACTRRGPVQRREKCSAALLPARSCSPRLRISPVASARPCGFRCVGYRVMDRQHHAFD